MWGVGGKTRLCPATLGFMVKALETRLGGTCKVDTAYVSRVKNYRAV